jgi:Flp pilus assembly protein TadD
MTRDASGRGERGREQDTEVGRPSGSRSQPGKSRGRRILVIAAVLAAVAGCWIAFSWMRGHSNLSPYRVGSRSSDEALGPGINWVGDTACARCHAEIAESYRRHPMGHSLAPVVAATNTGAGDGSGRVLFQAQGFEYSIEQRDGHVFHQETRRVPSGHVVARHEEEVQFAIGSGRQGVAYLIERDGFLFLSPMTWYPRKQRWDLSPGYEKENLHFYRPVQADCLFCHVNRVEPVAGPVNRYRPPIFRGHSIGCERCHGPGALHVKNPIAVDGRDRTIVNPAALAPSLRDAVCEQCHLQGDRRVSRLDHRSQDFRPGSPFHEFWTVLEATATPEAHRFVGQVEQMHESQCFRASRRRLGCISCHDPHRLPAPEEKVGYYRRRCLECHADRGCSLPATVRLERSRDDDCIVCHMPPTTATEVLHTATTNHRIPRRAEAADRPQTDTGEPRPEREPVAIFHRDLMDDRDRAAAERDIGVAVCRDGREGAAYAVPRLKAALAARPDDADAWEALGFALGLRDQGEEAKAAFQTALNMQPDREFTLRGVAYLATRNGWREEAIAYWRRAIAISPMRPDYRAELAALHFLGRDWGAAVEECRETLRLNPADLETRIRLVQCYLRLRDPTAARREFQTLLGFDLPNREELLLRFPTLSR